MGNGLTTAAALLALLLLTGGGSVHAQPAPSTANTATLTEHLVAGHRLRLVVEGDVCAVERAPGTGAAVRLKLDLRPPCHLLTWHQPPARTTDQTSDGVPLGSVGAPMAWRYPGQAGVVVLAVIGDPLPDNLRASSLSRLREQQGMRCAASVQGILLRSGTVELSKKREHVGVLCAELGLNEKDFWLLAHP